MKKMDEWEKESWLSALDESYLKLLWERGQADPHSSKALPEELLPESLRAFYEQEKPLAIGTSMSVPQDRAARSSDLLSIEKRLKQYRSKGHLYANFNPLGAKPAIPSELQSQLENHLLEALPHLSRFGCSNTQEWLTQVQERYCGSLSLEIEVLEEEQKDWGYSFYEELFAQECPEAKMREFFERLTAAEGLEKALASKFPGAKRFSLEGLDSFVILLEEILRSSACDCGVQEATLGLSHRGRLNIMINTLGKSPADLFKEFAGEILMKGDYSGDVKYHQGFSTALNFDGHELHVALSFNPSHLEVIGPVIHGSTRARQDKLGDAKKNRVLPIIIHGDAALSGQGVVMESLNMSLTPGYGVGGSIHIVLNNQIGFTTSKNNEARSTRYCTDIAKMLASPVLHVNADDPIAVWRAALWAAHYRARWQQDVFINLVGYRRLGHNEADDPSVTQPTMYAAIAQRPTALSLWGMRLEERSLLKMEEQQSIKSRYREQLERGECVAPYYRQQPLKRFFDWGPYLGKGLGHSSVSTGVPLQQLKKIGAKIIAAAKRVKLHPRLEKLFEAREKMYHGALELDWGAAELLAYGSLLAQGSSLRLSGQDAQRGTFFHRHAVVFDTQDGRESDILSDLCSEGSQCTIINSLLSEMAVMAFEYGYAMTDPNTLVIWEAQFGDFVNGAQVVIDQFLSSGEKKWQRLCGLTLFLPHGYEGQGPEHSSARIERFLQLAAQENMRIAYPSTPSQMFHLLRSQIKGLHRHPLVVFTPKSLLRLPEATSPLMKLSEGRFEEVLCQHNSTHAIRKILLCSGKIYYELAAQQKKQKKSDTLLVRLEQLYPFPSKALQDIFSEYHMITDIFWVQEEPANQGPWFFVRPLLEELSGKKVRYIGRTAQAAPAGGSSHEHERQQSEIIAAALS